MSPTTQTTQTKCEGCGCPLATGHRFCSDTCERNVKVRLIACPTFPAVCQCASPCYASLDDR